MGGHSQRSDEAASGEMLGEIRQTVRSSLKRSMGRQELHLRREEWRQRLNTELGGEMIKEIVFR